MSKMIKSFTIVTLIMVITTMSSNGAIIVLKNLKTESFVIKTTGQGVYPDDPLLSAAQKELMAKRAATLDAYRKILEQINEIQINSKTTIKDFLVQNDEVTAKVSGYIKGAKIVKVRDNLNGMVEVDVAIELGRDFHDIFQPYIK